jgi:hypothetical protein
MRSVSCAEMTVVLSTNSVTYMAAVWGPYIRIPKHIEAESACSITASKYTWNY